MLQFILILLIIAVIIAVLPYLGVVAVIVAIIYCIKFYNNRKYEKFEESILEELGIYSWSNLAEIDDIIIVKSRQSLQNYDANKYFKEDKNRLKTADDILKNKARINDILCRFLESNDYTQNRHYKKFVSKIHKMKNNASHYNIQLKYITAAGNNLENKMLEISSSEISEFINNPTLLMNKSEMNKILKEQQKELLDKKHYEYYDKVNQIIDFANKKRETIVVKGGKKRLDELISELFKNSVDAIKKIRTIDSEEWDFIGNFITRIENDIENIFVLNDKIMDYYDSVDFQIIKDSCESLMSTQREFNEYIIEKIETVANLFGTRVIRKETENQDEYHYIRPYKKSISPFTAEVSSAVFSSAENNPMDYLVKYFYPNKAMYPEQIQKLQVLIEELETLKEAKHIIENQKKEYRQYLANVPDYVLENDEDGFFCRLGFAKIDEQVLEVEYSFSYTSGGGLVRRSFDIPMTEETIIELIKTLESRLTVTAFAKEQRTLMTKKLREAIKQRDNFTCCTCGNSLHDEPNLLLEIDHIIPIAKGGISVESNLQTLCWKCNRSKGAKLM